MEQLSTEELIIIIEQAECTISEAAAKIAEAIKELKRRDSIGNTAVGDNAG